MNLSKSDRINKALKDMGIFSYKDVLFHLPRKYENLRPTPENNLQDKQRLVFVGNVIAPINTRRFKNISVSTFSFVTLKKNLFYVEAWNRPYLSKILNTENVYTLIGSYDQKNNKIYLINILKGAPKEDEYLKPIYALNRNIENHEFSQLVNKSFLNVDPYSIKDEIPSFFRKKYRLLDKYDALNFIHKPKNQEDIYRGLRVLKYEECLLFSLKTQIIRNKNKENIDYVKTHIDVSKVSEFIDSLPYKLTNDQKASIHETLEDMNSPHLMYRLLQGDVGTGKTLVAAILLYANYLRGDQGAFMAPTDALAKQHYQNLKKMFEPLGVKVGLLVASKSSNRSLMRSALINNQVDIVVGTHILFSKDINYLSLGLAVIDEQHKFGVNQRMLLATKGSHADLLLMSATPIPRTLALTLYGDLDVSTLNEFPSKKRDVETKIISEKDSILLEKIKECIANKKRVFIVAPSIMETDNGHISVETLFARYLLKFPGLVSLLHGKLDQDEKDSVLKEFISGKTPILISTTVIEVGIDVKDAELMIIYNPTHFGLASLHQLRGRIGRNGNNSTCLLVYDGNDEDDLTKLNVLVNSNDGFYIAEQDMKLRGPGELGGVRQSGIASFSFVNLVNDFRMFEVSRDDAKFILENSFEYDFKPILKRAIKEIELKNFTNS